MALLAAAPVGTWAGGAAAAVGPDTAAAAIRSAAERGGIPLVRDLKRLELEMMRAGARAELEERAGDAGRTPRPRRGAPERGTGHRPPRDREEAGAVPGTAAAGPASRTVVGAPLNHLVNDRFHDRALFSAQSENALAMNGDHVVAAWNDGEGDITGESEIGWGWSTDGGATWHDGGVPPLGTTIGKWLTDPVLAVDESTDTYYLCGVVVTSSGRNGIGVVRGVISDSVLVWDDPVAARSVRDTLLDKPWIAVDPASGRTYLAYTTFFSVADERRDQIEFQGSGPGGTTWSPPQVVSGADEEGLVQGARAAVGPDGEVHVVWDVVDTSAVSGGRDRFTHRLSLDGGRSFGPPSAAARLFPNFGSGAPGYNRGYAVTFPSISVDRTSGPWRGRTYLAWSECVDFFQDPLGTLDVRPESEPNGRSTSATPLNVGETVEGTVSPSGDVDWYAFAGSQGQTAVFYLDSLETGADVSLRVICGDGATLLAYSGPIGVRRRLIVFTLPLTGTFYLRVSPNDAGTGYYRLRTGFHTPREERARDQRDVFVTHSDDGQAWSTPVRVNAEPGHFDDWLPEVAVDGAGAANVIWYDWSSGPLTSCGGISSIRHAKSYDGGEMWNDQGLLTDALTNWSAVSSNLVPNQGDYIALAADASGMIGAWADGRYGDPDVFVARKPLPEVARVLAVETRPEAVRVEWQVPPSTGPVRAQRRVPGGPWTSIGELVPDADGRARLEDDSVIPGSTYDYALALPEGAGFRFTGLVTVAVPPRPALAITAVSPNPTPGPIHVRFAVPRGEPAVIELLDLAGRSIERRRVEVRGAGGASADLGAGTRLRPGIYLVRVRQSGRDATVRVAVVR